MVLKVGAMAAGAGIYKWTMVTPADTPKVPTPTPRPTLNMSLLNGLLVEYTTGGGGRNPGWKCLTELKWPNLQSPTLRRNLLAENFPEYDGETGNWTLRVTGDRCKGLETWEINDATGAIKYLGSSTSP